MYTVPLTCKFCKRGIKLGCYCPLWTKFHLYLQKELIIFSVMHINYVEYFVFICSFVYNFDKFDFPPHKSSGEEVLPSVAAVLRSILEWL